MSTALRPYQTALIDQARDAMRAGCRSLILQAPTGSGKTLLTAFMLKAAAAKGLRSIFCVHRRELLLQVIRAFDSVGLRPGLIAPGFPASPAALVQVASVQTLARRLHRLPDANLLIIDECHHTAARRWADVAARFASAYRIGLTATPERLDGKGLAPYFARLLLGPGVADLIAQGYLAPYRLYCPGAIQTADIKRSMGDYAAGALAVAADKPTITGDAISHYQRLAPGKRALVRCVSIQHSRHVAAQFQAAGIRAAHVDGDTETGERDAAFRDFAAGRLPVIPGQAVMERMIFGPKLLNHCLRSQLMVTLVHGLKCFTDGHGSHPHPRDE